MLGKLLKHELYATGKNLVPLYGITLILSLVNRIFIDIDIFKGTLEIIPVFMMIAYVVSIIATLFATFVFIVIRFYKNLMSDEGYLMFTLPVKSTQLINSKLITAVIWTVLSVITTFLSLMILLANPERIKDLKDLLDSIMSELKLMFGDKYVLFVVESIFLMIISLFTQILLIYVAITVGHLFNGHKVLGSFVAYFVINTAVQILITIILVVGGYLASSNLEEITTIPHLIFPFTITINLILSGVYYFASNYIFNKKLNLE